MAGATQSAPAAVLQVGNGAEPGTLDPQKTNGVWETRITRALFERLVTYAADGSLVPGLAESWTISDDGTTYTFQLRQAEWSDGTPITADDAVFALRRLLKPAIASHNAKLYYPIKNAGRSIPVRPSRASWASRHRTTTPWSSSSTNPPPTSCRPWP